MAISYDTSGVYVEVKPGDDGNWSGPLAYEQAHELRGALDTALAGVRGEVAGVDDRFAMLIGSLEKADTDLRDEKPEVAQGVRLALKYVRAFSKDPDPGALQGDG